MSRTSALLQQLLPALTLDLHEELQKESVYRTRQSCAVADEICHSALKQLQNASVLLRRMHNTAFSRAQFPPEIWCLVWLFLPSDQDLANVTHVCASWRSTATGNPALWTRLYFWTTVHAPRDVCDGRECSCPNEAQTHNLQQVEAWLERSKTASLALTVSIFPAVPERALAHRLAAIVLPHAHRLTDLICECGDILFFTEFLKGVQKLDRLRSLHISSVYHPHDVWLLGGLLPDGLRFPRLQEFHARGAIDWDLAYPSDASHAFAGLERLSCNFSDVRTFFDALRSCPRLVFLDAELCDLYDSARPRANGTDDASLAVRLEQVVLGRMTPRWSSLVEPLIRRTALNELTLKYRQFYPDPDTLFSTLSALSGTVHVSVLSDNDGVCVRARDSHTPRARNVELPVSHRDSAISVLRQVWRHFSAGALDGLTISWDLRGALLDLSLVAPQLSRIRLLVADHDAGGEVTAEYGRRPSPPALSCLEIMSPGRRRFVSRASARDFAAALSPVQLSLVLAGVDLV